MKFGKTVDTLIVLIMISLVLIVLIPTVNPVSADTSGTFGQTSVGSTRIGTGGVAAKSGGYFQLSSAGYVSKISAYVSGSGSAKCAIYSDSGGNPGSPIGGVTAQMSVPYSAGWVDFYYSTPVSLSAGNYWLVLIYNGDCNWYFSSGGVSAWNYVSYYNEPISPFGSHTDRSDLMSIYATYTSSSSSTTAPSTPTTSYTPPTSSSSSTINTASVIYAERPWTSTDISYIASHFDLIDVDFSTYGVSSIKAQNPSIKIIGYKDLLAMQPYFPDWGEVNTHEDWFIHDIYGNRIQNSLYGWYLMDVGNSGWREHWVRNVNSYMGSLFDGVFVDDVWNSLNGYVSGVSSSVYNNWHSNVLGMLQYIKANITPGKLVIINTDEWNSYTYVSVVDGQMLEGFVHCSWEGVYTQGTRNAALIMTIINNMATTSAAGKMVIGLSGTIVSSDSAAMARMVKYCYAGFLLAKNGPNAYWAFNNYYSSDGSHGYYPIMDTPIGNPTNSYYQSQNVYMRDYTNGKAIFNPSGNTYTINLGGTYKTPEGTRVTSITIGAYSGEVLTY